MKKPTVDDYLQQGIYGPKEIKPEEKRLYLGTFRERIIVVLTKLQVSETKVNNEVVELMQGNRGAQLLLNGHMNYSFLSKYIQKANDLDMSYTVVTNKEHDTKYGLVLAHNYAINKEDIFIHDKKKDMTLHNKKASVNKQTKTSFFKKIFRRK